MRARPDPEETAPSSPGTEPAPADDDFLYHLYRGSDMLMQDRVVEAKGELEQALSLQPQDAKGQDLLAGVYFRLGLYPRAIEIWDRLVAAYPRDATLRVNLSLAMLKTGQPADALGHLHAALQLQPDHDRAWGYLGLVHWRLGRHEDAREAFLRGGQASMARRMEDVLGTSAGALPSPQESGGEAQQNGDRAAMRSAAEEAIEQFEAEQVPLSVERSHVAEGGGDWRVDEPGTERVPARPRAVRALPAAAPPRLDALLDSWSLTLPEGTPLAVGPAGSLYVHAAQAVYARLDGLRAVRGELRTAPVQRRARGRDLDEVLGGDAPLMLWRAPVAAVIEPPGGRRFHGISLDDDVLYVREEVVWAFDDGLGFESGRLPLTDEPLVMLQLYGSGTVVLAIGSSPSALRVEEGEEVRVTPDALVGWTGRLLPRGPREGGTDPYQVHAPPLALRGDGIVLVA